MLQQVHEDNTMSCICMLTVWMIASQQDTTKKDNVWKIITRNLGLQKVCKNNAKTAEWWWLEGVPHAGLSGHHQASEPNLLCRVITGDETWIFDYDLETKHQSSQWKSDVAEAKESERVRVILIMTFNASSIVNSEFLPQGQMIN